MSYRYPVLLKRIKHISQSRLLRNILIVATGTAGAQAITMAFAPIITRLYGPEAFGLLGTFIAILAVLAPMVALTYPTAIVLPKSDSDAKGLAKLSMLIALFISALTAVLLFIWGEWAAQKLGMQEISIYLYLIPVAMLFSAFQQILEHWLIRLKRYGVTARVAVLQSVLLNSAKAGIGLYYPLAAILILLQTISSVIYTMLYVGTKNLDLFAHSENKKASIKELAYSYRDFAIYRAPEVTINAASQSLPVLMLAAFFGPASAGYYTLGRTVMGIPAGLIGKSVGDVFYPRISEAANNREKLYPLVCKATLVLAAVGFSPFLIVMIFGPWLFSFIFGIEWKIAGVYAQWLAPWLLISFLNSPSVKAIPILKAQPFQLCFTCTLLAARILALFSGYFFFESDLVAIALFGVSGSLFNLILIGVTLQKCKEYDRQQCF